MNWTSNNSPFQPWTNFTNYLSPHEWNFVKILSMLILIQRFQSFHTFAHGTQFNFCVMCRTVGWLDNYLSYKSNVLFSWDCTPMYGHVFPVMARIWTQVPQGSILQYTLYRTNMVIITVDMTDLLGSPNFLPILWGLLWDKGCQGLIVCLQPVVNQTGNVDYNNEIWLSLCDLVISKNWVNNGSGNGLVPDATKPWLEPMLTYHQ